jgi:hypothetical protein
MLYVCVYVKFISTNLSVILYKTVHLVPAVLSQPSCPSCSAPAVLSLVVLSSLSCLAVQPQLSCPVVLNKLSCLGCPVPIVLSHLFSPSCPESNSAVLHVIFWLSSPGRPVWLFCQPFPGCPFKMLRILSHC